MNEKGCVNASFWYLRRGGIFLSELRPNSNYVSILYRTSTKYANRRFQLYSLYFLTRLKWGVRLGVASIVIEVGKGCGGSREGEIVKAM